MIRVYADGVFDLCHYGHFNLFEQAKNLFADAYVIVGVCADNDVLTYKGRRPVMTQEQRCKAVWHCRHVDEVVCAEWVVSEEFIAKHKIDYVVHDTSSVLMPDGTDPYAEVKRLGMYRELHRTPDISTSSIKQKVLLGA